MIDDKKKYLDHIDDKEEIITLRKLLDNIEIVIRDKKVISTDFLNPYQRELSYSILNRFIDISYHEEGGYEDAERKVIIIYPDYLKYTKLDNFITIFKVTTSYEFSSLSHKDILGSLMGLGIKREKIGDIIISEDFAELIISKELKDYLTINLEKISNQTAIVNEIKKEDIVIVKPKYKEVQVTVSSLRLDVLIAAIYNLSRKNSSDIIKSGKVKVDFKPIDNISYKLNGGELISVRKKGRIRFEEILGKSKKEKYRIIIHKYIG